MRAVFIAMIIMSFLWVGCSKVSTVEEKLSSPTNLTLVPEGDSITITWEPLFDAASYTLQWDTEKISDNSELITGITSPEYVHKQSPETYYYRVQGVSSSGVGGYWSTPKKVVVTGGGLGQVQNLTVRSSSDTAFLQWDNIPNANFYEVYWGVNTVTENSQYFTVENTNRAVHDSLTVGMTYAYMVRAGNFNGSKGIFSSPVTVLVDGSTPLGVPQNVTTSSIGNSTIRVSWGQVIGATQYRIYYSTMANSINTSSPYLTTNLSYVDHTNLPIGQRYYYRVSALNNNGMESQLSAEVNGIAQGTVVGIPQNVIATPNGNGTVTVTWNPVQNVMGYTVYYSNQPVFNKNSAQSMFAPNSPQSLTLQAGMSYQIAVTAMGTNGESSLSEIIRVTPFRGK